ncbi:serine/threonine-protein kinase Nek11-like [Lethenteron reissneri]|uniref:serine/threonine-protein kinase Nek11-like n=1 Tax=Lethenteron reissneri TaxID=7753 RepID=UPI002AB6538F|nr:serine/threonine-protein kinase Nek11-like [Lethenteron reissneri]
MSRFRQVKPSLPTPERPPPRPPPPPPSPASSSASSASSPAVGGLEVVASRYEVQRRLGAGSFGSVYLVRDLKAAAAAGGSGGGGEAMCVLKTVPVGELRADETVHAHTEARLLARLRHPCIVRLHASFLERDLLCIVTELCEGGDLDARLERCRSSRGGAGEALPCDLLLDWLLQLLFGVHYMHSSCIIHRDLKTKNIFLSRNDVIKIGDFGVSRLLQAPADMASTFTGTPLYMSPEVLQLHAYGAKADVWAVGCVLYEMCALRPAFAASTWVQILRRILEEPAPALPPGFPPALNTILQRMLSKETSVRPSAEELLHEPFIQQRIQSSLSRLEEQLGAERRQSGVEQQEETSQVPQRKVHLETLRACAQVRAMTPRERMRIRKLQTADLHARKLQEVAEDHRLNNLRQRNINRLRNTANHLTALMNIDEAATAAEEEELESLQRSDRRSAGTEGHVGPKTEGHVGPGMEGHVVPKTEGHVGPKTEGHVGPGAGRNSGLAVRDGQGYEIPDDPALAEILYEDDFEVDSDDTNSTDDDDDDESTTNDSDVRDLLRCFHAVVDAAGDDGSQR